MVSSRQESSSSGRETIEMKEANEEVSNYSRGPGGLLEIASTQERDAGRP